MGQRIFTTTATRTPTSGFPLSVLLPCAGRTEGHQTKTPRKTQRCHFRFLFIDFNIFLKVEKKKAFHRKGFFFFFFFEDKFSYLTNRHRFFFRLHGGRQKGDYFVFVILLFVLLVTASPSPSPEPLLSRPSLYFPFFIL